MKKLYMKPSAVCIEVGERLMAGLDIPVSGNTTPEESDAKLYNDLWEEDLEVPDSIGFGYYGWY